MAELTFAPGVREQLAAIGRVRWQLFVNSLRTMRGRLELGLAHLHHARFRRRRNRRPRSVKRRRLLRGFERQSGMARCNPLADISFLAVVPGCCHRVHRKFRYVQPASFSSQLLIFRPDPNCLRLARAGHDAQLPLAVGSRDRSRNGLAESFSVGRPRIAPVCGGKHSARPHDLLLGGTLAGPAPHPRNPRRTFPSFHHQLSADWAVDEPLRPQRASGSPPIRRASLCRFSACCLPAPQPRPLRAPPRATMRSPPARSEFSASMAPRFSGSCTSGCALSFTEKT